MPNHSKLAPYQAKWHRVTGDVGRTLGRGT